MQNSSALKVIFFSFIFLISVLFIIYGYIFLAVFISSVAVNIGFYFLFIKDKLNKQNNNINSEKMDINTTLVTQKISDNIPFEDIKGLDYVKEELEDIVDFLKNPSKYTKFKIRLPKGVLLVGPPGIGKTMIAKSLANYINIPFYYQSGSSFANIYVGSGSNSVKELFNMAKKNAPSIIFIDEIDAIGKARGKNRNDERESTLNELLTQMDGFVDSNGVVVIGATNKIEVLDEALLRAGRFDKRIFVNLPTTKDREEIISYNLKNIPNNIDIKILAQMTAGASGSLISTFINEASLCALNRDSDIVTIEDFKSVKDKVFIGKKSKLALKYEDKIILSTYKASKAIGLYIFNNKFQDISLFKKENIKKNSSIVSKTELMSNIKVLLSGSAGTEIIFDNQFSCAQDDIKEAKKIASEIIYKYFLNNNLYEKNVNEILYNQFKEIKKILQPKKIVIETLAKRLIKKEELDSKEIKKELKNEFREL